MESMVETVFGISPFGEAAGGGAFTPASISSVDGWYSGRTGVTEVDVSGVVGVSGWDNQISGGLNNLVQGTASRRGTWNSTYISLLRGSIQHLESESGTLFSMIDSHIFFRARFPPNGSSVFILGRENSGYAALFSFKGRLRLGGSPALWGNELDVTGALTDNTWHTIELLLKSSGTSTMVVDGVEIDSTTAAAPASMDVFRLGAGYQFGGLQGVEMDIAQFVVSNAEVSGGDLTNLRTYLSGAEA